MGAGVTRTMSRTIAGIGSGRLAIFDHSRNRLRIPVAILPEALRQASGDGLASPVAAVKLETGGVMVDGQLRPGAEKLLRVIGAASMTIVVDVSCGGDASTTTIWATPSQAVITSSLDPELIDVEPVRVARIPERLSDVILLGRPETTADASIVVAALTMDNADRLADEPTKARRALEAGGVTSDDIDRLLAFQEPPTRRWRIGTTWSTDDGQQTAELEGIDAGPFGQWLVETWGDTDRDRELVFTPQGDGAILRALRGVLPRNWVGTALRRGAVKV